MSLVGILDYGAGNLKNVCRAIEHLGGEYELITNPAELDSCSKLIIPGVGAFKAAMDSLAQAGFVEPVKAYAASGKPVLGICLGMQMLFDKSYEFCETDGLGLIPGLVNLIPAVGANGVSHKIPHIGWNELKYKNEQEPLLKGVPENSAVYFVHSYMASPDNDLNLVAYSNYDELKITAIVRHKNVCGCQFHPEKSGTVGLKMLSNFLDLTGTD